VPDINIHRDHSLGLPRARKIAWQWAEEVENKFDMECTVIEGETSDTVEFTRSGVNGRLIVAGDHFELDAKLGFLLGAFSKSIEAEICKNLDALLAKAERGADKGADKGDDKGADETAPKPARKPAPKSAPKSAPKTAPRTAPQAAAKSKPKD